MYKPNDLIVYGNTGVCRVMDITTRDDLDIAVKGRLYYVLRPLYQDCIISAPVESEKVYIRPIMRADEVDKLIDSIPSINAEVFSSRVLRELDEHYDALIKTHDCATILELTMSLYKKKAEAEKSGKKFGIVDAKYLARAEELLFGEFAAALGIERDEVVDYIADRVERHTEQ